MASSDEANVPGTDERPDHLRVEEFEHGRWMRANITTGDDFHHGWLRLTDDGLEFHHHRIGNNTEIAWPRNTIATVAVEALDPLPTSFESPTGGGIATGSYDAWRVTITNAAGESHTFVVWDADEVAALQDAPAG